VVNAVDADAVADATIVNAPADVSAADAEAVDSDGQACGNK
jgi:hypothetical protein